MKRSKLSPCNNAEYLEKVWDHLNDQLREDNPGSPEWTVDDPRNEEFGKQAEVNEEATLGLLHSCPNFKTEGGIEASSQPRTCMLAPNEVCPLEVSVQALRTVYGNVEG